MPIITYQPSCMFMFMYFFLPQHLMFFLCVCCSLFKGDEIGPVQGIGMPWSCMSAMKVSYSHPNQQIGCFVRVINGLAQHLFVFQKVRLIN